MERILTVAYHEANHSFVTKGAGGIVRKETVIPEGRVLGRVTMSFNRLPFDQAIRAKMAVCVAGLIAEERIGVEDHSGCGADLAELDFLANMAAKYLGQGKLSAAHFKEQAYAKARMLTPDLSTLTAHAQHLVKEGIIL